MRKRLIADSRPDSSTESGAWLDLENLATVEVTSENSDSPIEHAFDPGTEAGWRAAEAGEQVIRLLFDSPRDVHRIQLQFCETQVERTQEFSLQWASNGGALREIVRQQWNFSPTGATTEVEDYSPNLIGASVLQLTIKPDIGQGRALASLNKWRVG
jgi:hypothetical protein